MWQLSVQRVVDVFVLFYFVVLCVLFMFLAVVVFVNIFAAVFFVCLLLLFLFCCFVSDFCCKDQRVMEIHNDETKKYLH